MKQFDIMVEVGGEVAKRAEANAKAIGAILTAEVVELNVESPYTQKEPGTA